MTKGEQITAELQRLSLIVSQRQTPTDQQNGSQTDTNRKADRQTEKLTDTHTQADRQRNTETLLCTLPTCSLITCLRLFACSVPLVSC